MKDNTQLSSIKGLDLGSGHMIKTILANGLIVTENEVLSNHYLVLQGEKIQGVYPEDRIYEYGSTDRIIDCAGQYILPGLIDIHSDMIENIVVPRKGIVFPIPLALFEADRQLIGHGITTIFHSVSIANSTICNRKRTLSVSDMINIGDTINELDKSLMIHHKFHARLEMNTLAAYDDVLLRVQQGQIHELSLMNHTPGQGQYASLDVFKREIAKQYGEISESQKDEIIRICQNKPLLTSCQISQLLACATSHGVPVAFHDVETEDQIRFMEQHQIQISEFPLNNPIAAKSAKKGLFNVVGAPNILLNGSHNNNASATELLELGYANIICSDYYSPSLLASIFLLPKITHISLPEAVNFASLNPAHAVGIDKKYGSITSGKNADLIVVNSDKDVPRVTLVFIDGSIQQQTIL